MPFPRRARPAHALTSLSRRRFLRQSAALTLAMPALRPLAATTSAGRVLAWVGTYNTPSDGAGGNGKGILAFEMSQATGELHPLGLVAPSHNASWIAFHPSRDVLYAGNEVGDFGGTSGSVSAYTYDRNDGSLHLLNVVSSEGAGPAHLSVDATGKFVFVANYAGGTAAVLPINGTGGLEKASCVVEDHGSLGSKVPTSAPPGSFAFSGHDKPHAHMIQADPGNRFVLQTDLGQDRIYVYRLDASAGKLVPAAVPFVTVPDGDGPRHFVFHPNGRWLYSLQEEGSTVIFFHFDPATGAMSRQQMLSTLPSGFAGTNFTSEILLSPDSRFLYAANRLHDTIAVFALEGEGRLRLLGETSTMGSYPRHIQIAPGGSWLYACDQRSDSIACFRVNKKTGGLSFSGKYTAVGSPACIVFRG